MRKKAKKNYLTLVGFDIEGEWNLPLLKNAVDISGASIEYIKTEVDFIHLQKRFDKVIACEITKKSQNIYDFPSMSGRIAIIVGNEHEGVPKKILRKMDQVVSIPMYGKNISSVNVAVAAAISLYALNKDFARKKMRKCQLSQQNIDILLSNPEDPNEIGSLLRSAWAFGWQHVFLSDNNNVWFTKNRKTILAGRAAARREVNAIKVIPVERINFDLYDHIYVCNRRSNGIPLSKAVLSGKKRVLIIFGTFNADICLNVPIDHVHVDFYAKDRVPNFRHEGSTLLSVISEMSRRGCHG
jgi:tRNA(Leu) C34 or U34 (ribose-2'-O)-methylase TrmL